jgi:hypothetical protein
MTRGALYDSKNECVNKLREPLWRLVLAASKMCKEMAEHD